jgi:hypothetical protein
MVFSIYSLILSENHEVALPVLQSFLLFGKIGIYSVPAKDFLYFPNVGQIIMNLL